MAKGRTSSRKASKKIAGRSGKAVKVAAKKKTARAKKTGGAKKAQPRSASQKKPGKGVKKQPAVLQAAGGKAASPATAAVASRPRKAATKPAGADLIPIVAVGASAGGLEAFTQLLQALPEDTGMAFVLVSHLSHTHKSMLSELLAKSTKMPVSQVARRTTVRPNQVYVIPPNMDLEVGNGVIKTKRLAKTRRPHMVIDHFMRSLAESRKSRAIGVVLSGSGTDGTLGLAAIKAEGGITFAQDEESAKYPDMPRSANLTGSADLTLPPHRIAAELNRVARHPYVAQGKPVPVKDSVKAPADELGQIFRLVRDATGVDFSHYKPTTIKRRISRRMLVHKIESLGNYLKLLRTNPNEVEALFHDLLVNVTAFFRDPEIFEVLQRKFIPNIVNRKPSDVPIRAWVPGCATGEEAYSVAICLLEALGDPGPNPPLQIFGTDISDVAIRKAREGRYPQNIAIDVSPERLRRFFVKTEQGYQISKLVRDLCVFATQNLVKDPPFSRMDLITCRNVLIYLGPLLQKRALATFHYALKPTGCLVLGSSETIGTSTELFRLEDKKQKIYSKVLTARQPDFEFGTQELEREKLALGAKAEKEVRQAADITGDVDRILLKRYTPAGVVINRTLDIVQFRGQTSPFLEPAPGQASLNLLKMAREGLLIDLRAAIHQAQRSSRAVKKEGVQVRSGDGPRTANLEVIPLRGEKAKAEFYLVVFEDTTPKEPSLDSSDQAKAKSRRRKQDSGERQVVALREQLASTQEDLHSIIEEQEASNEELQSANEEILSSNEELQSTNEEMETAKEELQATNEELTTVNEELRNRNAELTQSNDDMMNLLGSVDIIIVMLGQDLRIRLFTQSAQRVMNLIPSDVGRPLRDINTNLQILHLEELVSEVIDTMVVKEQEIQDLSGRWYSMRLRPYRTVDNRIDGAVLALVEIDELKRATEGLHLASKVFQLGADPIIVQDLDGNIVDLNDEAVRTYGWSRQELLGQPIKTLVPPDRHTLTEKLLQRCKRAEAVRNVEGVRWNKARQRLPGLFTLSLIKNEKGEAVNIASIAKHPGKPEPAAGKSRKAAS